MYHLVYDGIFLSASLNLSDLATDIEMATTKFTICDEHQRQSLQKWMTCVFHHQGWVNQNYQIIISLMSLVFAKQPVAAVGGGKCCVLYYKHCYQQRQRPWQLIVGVFKYPSLHENVGSHFFEGGGGSPVEVQSSSDGDMSCATEWRTGNPIVTIATAGTCVGMASIKSPSLTAITFLFFSCASLPFTLSHVVILVAATGNDKNRVTDVLIRPLITSQVIGPNMTQHFSRPWMVLWSITDNVSISDWALQPRVWTLDITVSPHFTQWIPDWPAFDEMGRRWSDLHWGCLHPNQDLPHHLSILLFQHLLTLLHGQCWTCKRDAGCWSLHQTNTLL